MVGASASLIQRVLVDLPPVLGRDVAEAPARVAEEEEAHDLEDPLALPHVDVADVAELLEQSALDPGLLRDLAHGGVGRALAVADDPLGKRPDLLPGRADGSEMPLPP